ncbi:MAG: nucleotidyl transferase AbiEii/AbiGii toxin family protein [Fimbriiglobus sp.]
MGDFEVHLTAAGDAERFAEWCVARGLKCVRIVLARGDHPDQPMATWRRGETTFEAVLAEAEAFADEARQAWFVIDRVKIEASPWNADVPVEDLDSLLHPPSHYFEQHIKLRRERDADTAKLLAVCEHHHGHLSRNAFRQDGEFEERFVTIRHYGVGRVTAEARLTDLLAALEVIDETVLESETEYCLYDSRIQLDDGWLSASPPRERKSNMADPHVTHRVMMEFLRCVSGIVDVRESFFPALRGSLLLQHWYPEKARPAGDIDFEVFAAPNSAERIVSLTKMLCCEGLRNSTIHFEDPFGSHNNHPESLWSYGTPGERFYANWRTPAGETGRLQIDIAHHAAYTAEEAELKTETFTDRTGNTFTLPAYSRETMLAAKVSWLMRGFRRNTSESFNWVGEPKDLYDAYLLAHDKTLNAKRFQAVLAVMGRTDELYFPWLDYLFEIRRRAIPDRFFKNWEAFREKYPGLELLKSLRPTEMWEQLANQLEPLLGSFYSREEMPLLNGLHLNTDKELRLGVYADWLEDHGDDRAELVRQIASAVYDRDASLKGFKKKFLKAPLPWLLQLFGTHVGMERFQEAFLREA